MSIPTRILRRTLIPLAAVAVLSACSGGAEDSTTQIKPHESSDAALADRYGFAPRPDPSITYQPDVIMIEGGPKVIRGVSADGLTWSVDASAPGVDRLQPGTIMFLTSQAVGRVMRLSPMDDQMLGGLIMWIPGGLYFFAIISVIFYRWQQAGGHDSRASAQVDLMPVAPGTR